MATTITLKPNAIDISGSTSGTTTLQATAVAGTTTVTLPAATDTLVGKATTDTLTNKTLTNPTINGFTGDTSVVNLGSGQFYKDTSGNIGVGTSSPSTTFGTPSKIAIVYPGDTTWGIGFKSTYLTGSGQPCTFINSSNSVIGYIGTNGTTTSYVTSSDYRLKEEITPMTGALEKVAALNPVTYKWKSNGEITQGFIAHELQEVVPECVVGEKDAVETYTDEEGAEQTRPKYQGIDTSFLVATLAAAIQELKAIVDTQAARITALEQA